MIAEMIRNGRLSRGYTQKELAELSHISVRSIQRIENAEIVPRSYTLKTLAGILDISFDNMQDNEAPALAEGPEAPRAINNQQKVILSVGISSIVLLFSWAFIEQSPRFPETRFELAIFLGCIAIVITVLMSFIWRSRR